MDQKTAQEIKSNYNEYDTNFRDAKKRGDFKKAALWKAKRDALNLSEALAFLRQN